MSARDQVEVSYPLALVKCDNCGHFFSGFPTDPDLRYVANEYSYESANSAVSIAHFAELAAACVQASGVSVENLDILDVGSNDGTLLGEFRDLGASNVVGVDPSPNMGTIAATKGISNLVSFFESEVADDLRKINRGQAFDVVVSANVVNHADDPHGFVKAVDKVIADDGIFVFEVPNVIDLIRFRGFEAIYHEHVHYWSLGALRKLLAIHGFSIFRFEFIDYMCGSIRVFASRSRAESPLVSEAILRDAAEEVAGPLALKSFAEDVVEMKYRTLAFLSQEKLNGTKIIGIGAATKGNTLLNYFGLDSDLVDFITDTAESKIGKVTPGSKIEIVHDDELLSGDAETLAIILPWNLDRPLREKFKGAKIRFLTPQVDFLSPRGKNRKGIYGET